MTISTEQKRQQGGEQGQHPRNFFSALLLSLILLAATHPVLAQTPTMPLPPTPSIPSPPVPASIVAQAKAQAKGQFTSMRRAGVGGQVQEAWDEAKPTDGVFRFQYCRDCTYKVRLRQHMVTVIQLPKGETITRADVGDSSTFQVQLRGSNRLAVKPVGFGVDTNLMVYGKSGTIYPIYLRAERFNSVNIPDLLMRIEGTIPKAKEVDVVVPDNAAPATDNAPQADAGSGPDQPAPLQVPDDFVEKVPFDPDKLRGWGDYKLWSGGLNGAGLKPETVFRDDYFTYIRFGKKWKDLELPVAYVVVDGIDELVNTRIKGHTYIIESTQKLITLKSGESFLCIEYVGTK